MHKKLLALTLCFLIDQAEIALGQKAYKDFEKARTSCGTCLEIQDDATMETYVKDLLQLEKNLKPTSNGSDVETSLLLALVLKGLLKCKSALLQHGKAPSADVVYWIEKIHYLQRINLNRSTVFQAFSNKRWTPTHLKILGVSDTSRLSFDATIWPSLHDNLNECIFSAEEIMYEKLAPERTLRQLKYFISKSTYTNGSVNHRASDAFMLYFKGLTLSGDPLDFTAFKDLATIEMAKVAPWPQLFNQHEFDDFFKKESRKLSLMAAKMIRKDLSDEDLKTIATNAAPYDLGLIAIQRLLAPHISNRDMNRAREIYNSYANLYDAASATPFIRQKYSDMGDLLESLYDQTEIAQLVPVNGLSQPGVQEVRFHLSKSYNSEQFLALDPVPVTDGSLVRVFKKQLANAYKFDSSREVQLAGSNIYWFEQKDRRAYNRLNEISERQYPLSQIPDGENSYDYWLEPDVIFFASYSSSERMTNYDPSTSDNTPEYLSPGFVHDKIKFQETNHTISYHGRAGGNGNTDLYYMVRNSNGHWSRPQLLRDVNTPFCERAPVYQPSGDGGMLYFASEGRAGLGGFDIYEVRISVDRENQKVNIDLPVRNMIEVNTMYDELYYVPTDRNNSALLSSNKEDGKDFDIYTRKGENIAIPAIERIWNNGSLDMENQEEIQIDNRVPPTEQPVLPPSKDINFSKHCHWDETEALARSKGPMQGRIRVSGYIFDWDQRLYESAFIIFQQKGTNEVFTDTVTKASRGLYSVYLREGFRYFVRVYGYQPNGQMMSGFTENFIEICLASGDVNAVSQDFETESVDSIFRRGRSLLIPFFFDTNKHDYTISSKREIEVMLKDLIPHWTKVVGARILLLGFADERGNATDNLLLSGRRVEYAKRFILSLPYGKIPVDTKACGESIIFDFEALNNPHVPIIISKAQWELLRTDRDRCLQMNRRVEVRIIGD